MKILLVATDKDISSVMKKGELNFVSTSSATSAKIMFADGGVDVVIIDDEIKGAEALEKFAMKKSEVLVIGRELSRPLEIEELKAKLKVIEDPAGNKKMVKKESGKEIVDVEEVKEKSKGKKKIESVKKMITEKTAKKEHKQLAGEELESLQRKVNKKYIEKEKIEKKRQQKKTKHYILPTMVVSFWGVKGGAGRTSILANFAYALKDVSICIIDLNFCDGGSDLSYYFDLPKIPHIGTYLSGRNKESFKNSLLKVKGNNIHVLQAPPATSLTEQFTPNDLIKIVEYARRNFTVILFDLPVGKNELVKEALDMSNFVYLVSEGGLNEAERLKSCFKEIEEAEANLIINKASGYPRELVKYLGVDPNIIQYDEKVINAIGKRRFVLDENSSFGEGIRSLISTTVMLAQKELKSCERVVNIL
ncbi:cellulose synthase operon protein YhjQ/BcsQ [Candidatus Oleimmundimicrobium sp.]|uniref:AAA family ATPase n=1 Tax=Candidatus Oleimmundimicrobium sp. TaxID=3060597 RepID=UPI00271EF37D|nr:cellulose synthase operon protein YhjQ/BcsQ [Candidatus Oleimmundimicrobium sp.]MDO8886672.1 cellulose synthase operon protein YhjQ/BcsQ [Candidatus Oleimmundimicrobium sp.]